MEKTAVLIGISLLGLAGCASARPLPGAETTAEVTASVAESTSERSDLVNGRLRFKEPTPDLLSLIETEKTFSVGLKGELVLFKMNETTLTPSLIEAFFTEKVNESSAAGILLQSQDVIFAFLPTSPVFHMWQLSGDLAKFEVLLDQIGVQYAFIPPLMTTDFFSEAFAAQPNLSATFIGSGLLAEDQLHFTSKKERQGFDYRKLKQDLKTELFGREVEFETTDKALALKIYLNDKEGFHEEGLRKTSPRVLKTIQKQEKHHQFDSFSVEFLAKPSHPDYPKKTYSNKQSHEFDQDLLLASLDLSVHELYTLPWEGQLNQTLAERLDYFRYYGGIEYE